MRNYHLRVLLAHNRVSKDAYILILYKSDFIPVIVLKTFARNILTQVLFACLQNRSPTLIIST